jgi:Spy/CpxP family protein refolding chaperone
MKLNQTLALAALLAGSLFASSLAVHAQDTTNTPPATVKPGLKNPRGLNINALAKQLDLTDDQKPKVKTVLDEQMQKQRDLRTDTTLSAEDKKAKLKELRDGTDAKLKDILTPDQFTKWQKFGATHRRPMPMAAPGTAASTNAPATVK